MPGAYAASNGEVLVAVVGEFAIGCIAYRELAASPGKDGCEIKRLFVLSEHRARGVGRSLVIAALDHARLKGYKFACLDTEPQTMAAAHQTYRKLGFIEYDRRTSPTAAISFLRAPLT